MYNFPSVYHIIIKKTPFEIIMFQTSVIEYFTLISQRTSHEKIYFTQIWDKEKKTSLKIHQKLEEIKIHSHSNQTINLIQNIFKPTTKTFNQKKKERINQSKLI